MPGPSVNLLDVNLAVSPPPTEMPKVAPDPLEYNDVLDVKFTFKSVPVLVKDEVPVENA
jgi:hypothetical protein